MGFAPDEWRLLFEHLRSLGFAENEIQEAGLAGAGSRGPYDRFRGRVMFPIADFSGRVIGFSGRLLKESENEGKYINTPQTVFYDKSRAVFGIDKAKEAIRESSQTIFVEGQMDVILAHQAGTKNVVGVSGTALTGEHLSLVGRLSDRVILILDPDEAGLRASNRSVLEVLSQGLAVWLVVLPVGQDPADIAAKSESRWRELAGQAVPFIEFALLSVARRRLSSRDLFKAVRSEIYPYLKVMRWELERDEAFGKIAAAIGSGVDALRQDFITWSMSSLGGSTAKWARQGGPNSPSQALSRKERVVLRLLGLILWQESQIDRAIDTAAARKKLEEVLGATAPLADPANKERLVFEAEALYLGSLKLSEEIALLLKHLEEEVLKERLNENLIKLRQVEKNQAAGETEKLLADCQEISEQIRKLQLNR